LSAFSARLFSANLRFHIDTIKQVKLRWLLPNSSAMKASPKFAAFVLLRLYFPCCCRTKCRAIMMRRSSAGSGDGDIFLSQACLSQEVTWSHVPYARPAAPRSVSSATGRAAGSFMLPGSAPIAGYQCPHARALSLTVKCSCTLINTVCPRETDQVTSTV